MSDKMNGRFRWLWRITWTYPVVLTEAYVRRFIDRDRLTIVASGLFGVLVALSLGISSGARLGWWGKTLQTAWRNEEVARHNVTIADAALAVHESHRPTDEDLRRYSIWLEDHHEILMRRSEEASGVPSLWSPCGASQPWTRATLFSAIIYQVDHFFLRSIWPAIALAYGCVGAVREIRRRRRAALVDLGWQAARQQRSPEPRGETQGVISSAVTVTAEEMAALPTEIRPTDPKTGDESSQVKDERDEWNDPFGAVLD
jgi:hypothetical protein